MATASTSPITTLMDLPDELLLDILQLLDLPSLATSVAPVCQRLYRLATHPLLWTMLDLRAVCVCV
eukprot:m.9660 g.9660  ORF g.9660 m.9660 type:complete len:66 (-) comp3578_c0_seq1:6-203(-)